MVKKKTKKIKKSPRPSIGVSVEIREKMFYDYWYEDISINELCRKYDLVRPTISKIKADDKWEKRKKENIDKIRRKNNRKIVCMKQHLIDIADRSVQLASNELKKLVEKDFEDNTVEDRFGNRIWVDRFIKNTKDVSNLIETVKQMKDVFNVVEDDDKPKENPLKNILSIQKRAQILQILASPDEEQKVIEGQVIDDDDKDE